MTLKEKNSVRQIIFRTLYVRLLFLSTRVIPNARKSFIRTVLVLMRLQPFLAVTMKQVLAQKQHSLSVPFILSQAVHETLQGGAHDVMQQILSVVSVFTFRAKENLA
jgi:hypothetical protein